MKIKSLLLAAQIGWLAPFAPAAHADVHIGIGFGLVPPPVYYGPPPAYYTPPPPVYYGPGVVYGQGNWNYGGDDDDEDGGGYGGGYGGGWGGGDGWAHDRWHGGWHHDR